jgi:hypothetical protein
MPWVGFQPTIPLFEREKAFDASYRAATVIGKYRDSTWKFYYNGFLPHPSAPDERWWWLSRNWWNEDWEGKPKYWEKTCLSATLSTTNSTWLDPGLSLLSINIGHSKQKKKKMYMHICPIPKGFLDRAISLYSSKIVEKKEILSTSSYYRVLTMVYNFQKYWVFGLYPSSWY